jgi:hypothetical protein
VGSRCESDSPDVDDLITHATVDADGVRWSNHEQRATPSTLEPYVGWVMGNAGIIRELLRFARVRPVVDSRVRATPPVTSTKPGRAAVVDQ